jgi:hypothetical protein
VRRSGLSIASSVVTDSGDQSNFVPSVMIFPTRPPYLGQSKLLEQFFEDWLGIVETSLIVVPLMFFLAVCKRKCNKDALLNAGELMLSYACVHAEILFLLRLISVSHSEAIRADILDSLHKGDHPIDCLAMSPETDKQVL